MTPLPVETELKLRAEDDTPLLALAAMERLGPATLGPAETYDELDRYLDTADGRLAAARWACRLRTRRGETIVSLKGPAEHQAGELLHRRPELEGPAVNDPEPRVWPPSAARDLLDDLSGREPLVERLRLLQRRTERSAAVEANTIGRLTLDDCHIVQRGTELGRLFVVELELADAGDPAAEAVAAALRAIPGLKPDPASKLEHALALVEARA